MQFEVPQFIEIEDKIFGPLTWKQFLFLGGGVGIAVVLFITANFFVFLLVGLPLALLGGALAFVPINNRPFSFFLEAVINYFRGQRLYLWRQKSDRIYKADTSGESDRPLYAAPPTVNPHKSKKDISSLARKLELQALQKSE
jgi:hypothetical protein